MLLQPAVAHPRPVGLHKAGTSPFQPLCNALLGLSPALCAGFMTVAPCSLVRRSWVHLLTPCPARCLYLADSLDQPEIGGELLGDRVAALEARAGLDGEAGAAAAGEAAAAAAAAGTAGAGAVATPSAAPGGSDKADSLAVLLTQALRAGDKSLLEHCLSASNPRVINNTVARLVPLDAAAFLRTAVDRLLSKPARAVQLAPWIKAVLHHHTAYIMTSPGAQAPLTALYQAIDGRVSLYAQLLRLHGRLGLITAHARAGAATGDEGVDGMVGGRPAPEVVFQDAEESDEEPEAEDAFGGGDYDDEDEEGEGSEGSEDGDEDEDDEDGFDGGMDEDDDDDDE